jgi:hypothetical protein
VLIQVIYPHIEIRKQRLVVYILHETHIYHDGQDCDGKKNSIHTHVELVNKVAEVEWLDQVNTTCNNNQGHRTDEVEHHVYSFGEFGLLLIYKQVPSYVKQAINKQKNDKLGK